MKFSCTRDSFDSDSFFFFVFEFRKASELQEPHSGRGAQQCLSIYSNILTNNECWGNECHPTVKDLQTLKKYFFYQAPCNVRNECTNSSGINMRLFSQTCNLNHDELSTIKYLLFCTRRHLYISLLLTYYRKFHLYVQQHMWCNSLAMRKRVQRQNIQIQH